MIRQHHCVTAISLLTVALVPTLVSAQTIRRFDNNNNLFQQNAGSLSVRDERFDFLGGNDRLLLLRNDDLAGLSSGVADMGEGRDVVVTSFNMSGLFRLGGGDDLFLSEGDVSFNGNATDIVVLAGSGNDIIAVTTDFCAYDGELGNDVFISNGSNNTFDGGEGNDTYSVEAAESGAQIDLAQESAFVRFTTPEFIFNMEHVRGSDFGDEILGDSKSNRIDGLGGDDAIDGDAGNDTIDGGAGNNQLFGSEGIDTLVILGTVTSSSRESADTIRVAGILDGVPFEHIASGFEQVIENGELQSVGFFLDETAENITEPTVIADTSVLAKLNALVAGQTLNGNANANTINGGAGSDDIAGLGGNDRLDGKGGDDVILGGAGADTLLGAGGNDSLFGGLQNDTLIGGPGADILDGGDGSDRLTGGAGNDIFVFSSAFAGSADVVTDYKVIEDTIQIRSNLVGNLPRGVLAANRFKNTAQGAVDADDRILYDPATGRLSFDRNGRAAGGVQVIATLPRRLAMTPTEIIIR